MTRITTLLFLLIPFFGISQKQQSQSSIVEKEIQEAKNVIGEFQKISIFQTKNDNEIEALKTQSSTKVIDGVYFDFEKAADFNSKAATSSNLTLEIPSQNKNQPLLVDLIRVDIHSSDFLINVPYVQGFHYRGVVRGSDHSLVSISIFDEEVIGFVSYNSEVLTLGKVRGENKTHVLYNEFNQNWNLETNCSTSDDDITYNPEKVAHAALNKSPGDCVKLKFEIDESLTDLLGGTIAATNYGTGIFNNQMTMYANDGANIVLSELKVWTTANPAPYNLDEYNTLGSYQALTGSYNGDVAYLGFYQNAWQGGVAAGIGGICQANVDDTKAIGGHLGFYSDIPTYTYDVLIISHEVGHLFGARHTHACVWNGNNTAIDGCSGATEGGCALPGSPAAGTIMSYCQPVDFVEGFNPQVAQAIQDYIATRACTVPCGDITPTCVDGYQNGNETGIDCGGPDCGVCPTCDDGILNGDEIETDCGGSDCAPCPCFGETLNLAITFDNYATETSWQITNDIGAVVVSGNNYGGQATGTTLNIAFCLNTGCYDLTFFDSFGDGICCAFGTGSYTLTGENGDVYATGGEFLNSETTSFCAVSPNSTVSLNLKTFLEGPYQEVPGTMNDNLRSNGLLPLLEPYTALGYTLPSTSTSIVVLGQTGNDAIIDWILVELRSSADPTVVIEKQAALLQRDGDIVSVDGISPVEIDFGSETDVYIALRHRNHLGIRTANFYSTAAPIALEFSNPLTNLFGSNAVKDIGGVNVMISGDANTDGTVNSIDKNNYWRVQNGEVFDYSTFRGDFNLDGSVNSIDKNLIWRLNNSSIEQLD